MTWRVDYYSPGQLKVIIPFLPHAPRWLVIAGPADANEAQTARELWPDIKIIGVEPNPEAVAFQRGAGWPEDCPLLEAALSEACGRAEMCYESGRLRNGSLDPTHLGGNRGNPVVTFRKVLTVTLDDLDRDYGPLEDAVVWMDIEGSEYHAMLGATNLLRRRAVLLWNVEMQTRIPGLMEGIAALMDRHGYRAVHEWNDSDSCRDRVYVRE